MEIKDVHSWEVSPKEAVGVQKRLVKRLKVRALPKKPGLIASADVAFRGGKACGAVVCMAYPELKIVESVFRKKDIAFPYVPTLLTFREGPVLCECFRSLKRNPELVIFDGQGIAHPRKIGLAAHLGILLGRPSIGCAKSRLYGDYREPGQNKGDFSYLEDNNGEKIGVVLRTRSGVKPIFVSPGHMMDIKSSMEIVLECVKKYRIPEPVRISDRLSKT